MNWYDPCMSIDRADNFIASLGVEAYRVGGSVRDEVLGRTPKDADYMVRGVSLAELGEMLRLRHVPVPKLRLRDGQHVGYRVGRPINAEITLPRKEISTGPGHGDFEIVADPDLSLAEDAKRRDFTFNALYRVISHPEGLSALTTMPDGTLVKNVLDPTSRGLHDLAHGCINVTHADSFRDDPLRILRALRFVSVLGYSLSAETLALMAADADSVTGLTGGSWVPANGNTKVYQPNMSGTVLDEMSKILMGDNVEEALTIAAQTGVLGTLFPELADMIGFEQESRYHDMTTDAHTFRALATAAKVNAPLRVRWALLFHDAGKPKTAWRGEDGRLHYYARPNPDGSLDVAYKDHADHGETLWRAAAERMNAPRALREDVATLIKHHMVTTEGRLKASKVRRMRIAFGDALLHDLLLHRACDISGKGNPSKAGLTRIAAMESVRAEAEDSGVPATVKELAVNGRDAQELGIQGRWIGGALKIILDDVASEPSETHLSRDWQLAALGRIAKHRANIDRAVAERPR